MATQGHGCSVPDHVLVAGLRHGDTQAGDLLVARYYDRVRAYLASRTGDPELARDLAQDTFELAIRRLDQLRDDGLFAAWLHQIARTRLLMERRIRRGWRFLPLDALRERSVTPPAVVLDPALELVQQALAALSPADRQLLVQHIVWGMHAAEIADSQGTTRGAIYQRLQRAKVRLKQQLDLARAQEGLGE